MAHALVQSIVAAFAVGSRDNARFESARLVGMLATSCVGFLAIRPRRAADKTGGVAYGEADGHVGIPIERYENPAAVVARRLRKLEREGLKAMGGNQAKQAKQGKRTSVEAEGAKGVKLKVCRARAHHSAQVAPASPPAAEAVGAGQRSRVGEPQAAQGA